jgi:hypothetical protein
MIADRKALENAKKVIFSFLVSDLKYLKRGFNDHYKGHHSVYDKNQKKDTQYMRI